MKTLYTKDSPGRLIIDFLNSWKWPIVGLLVLLITVFALGWVGVPEIPDQVWGFAFYLLLGLFPGIPIGILVVRWLDKPEGQELWDFDPITDDHRHLRCGPELWEEITVLSPWGEEVGTGELKDCTINGRSGYEVMDYRVTDDGPVCVSTFVGEASSAMLRTYKSALIYARRRLAHKAERATALEANLEPIARECAEEVVTDLIRTAEKSGTPGGENIEGVVEGVLEDFGLNDPLKDDDLGDWLDELDGGGQNRDQDDDQNGDDGLARLESLGPSRNGGGPS